MKRLRNKLLVGAGILFTIWLMGILVQIVLDINYSGADPRFQQQEPHLIPGARIPREVNETFVKDILQRNPKIIAAILHELKEIDKHSGGKVEQPENEPKKEEENKEAPVAVLKPPEANEGPGEMGKPVVLKDLTEEEKKKNETLYSIYAFNVYVSDMISLHRKLPDFREPKCREPGKYRTDLPATSVIICFHNEAWSILLRTVHSVLDRTPENLLQEIILVDDYSDLPHLKHDLEEYISRLPKVRLIRTRKREGLVRARILGAKGALAPVLTYLDSHCEASIGWAEPLLDVIARNSKATAVPVIGTINDQTFEYKGSKCTDLQVGGFDWSLSYNWHVVPKGDNEGRHPCDNVRSPTMAGGLFAIGKKFFQDIGYYDEKMDVWGGENLEISFKIWMCGGSLIAVPCSHIGHIFRKFNPYAKKSTYIFGEFVRKNVIRVAKAWLDEFAALYYKRTGTKPEEGGNVENELEVRRRLQCHSFEWYLDNVYPDLFIPTRALASGEIRNLGNTLYCLDTLGEKLHKPVGSYQCHGVGGTQDWSFTKLGEIRHDGGCLDYSGGGEVIQYPCHGMQGNQHWFYNDEKNYIENLVSRKCLGIDSQTNVLGMFTCGDSKHVQWKFETVHKDRLKEVYG